MSRRWNRVWEEQIAPAMELPFPPEECGAEPRAARRALADDDQDAFNRLYLPRLFSKPTTGIHRAIDGAILSDRNVALWAPRGIGKSARGVACLLRLILTGQESYVLYGMKTVDDAVEAVEILHLELLENPRLRMDYGAKVLGWVDGKLEVEAAGAPRCVEAFGMGQAIRGSRYREHRPGLLFIDDPHTDEEARNRDRLDKSFKWLRRSVAFLGAIDTPVRVKILMTRMAEGDYFGQLQEVKQTADETGAPFSFDLIGLPIAEPDGTSNVPEILSDAEIAARRAEDPESVDQEWFGVVAERASKFFSAEGFNYYKPGDLDKVRLRKRMSVDPSLGRSRRSDTSSVLVIGYTNTKPREYYPLLADIGRRPPPVIARAMFDAFMAHRDLELIVYEDVGFQEAAVLPEFLSLCDKAGVEPPSLQAYRPTEDKDARVGVVARAHGQSRIHYNAAHGAFNRQCQNYPLRGQKDGPDAFAQFLLTLGGEHDGDWKPTVSVTDRRVSWGGAAVW